MEKAIILSPFHGLASMVVCVQKDMTDAEILAFCNQENPSGTTNGWAKVERNNVEYPKRNPVVCDQDADRLHLIIDC